MGFAIGAGVLFLLMLAVLELNKNTLLGFALAIAAAALFVFVHGQAANGGLRFLCWIGWIALFALILFATWPPVRAIPAVEGESAGATEIVTLKNGQVQAPWDGVRVCDHFAPMSMQPTNLPIYDSLAQIIGYHDYKISLKDNSRAPVSEDALYLNVWKPAGAAEGLPVYVYVHGGSLQTGQPWYGDYRGENLAREGAVYVNFAYRLGVFGYLADSELAEESPNGTTGNYGLLDQIKALEWVRDNIAAFGGDPDNITLAGESAGAASVSALCTSPLAAGLFRRVLLELRAIPAEKLVGEAATQHHMTVDGYALTETPYESYRRGVHNEQAILHGYNSRESGPFILFSQASLKDYEQRIERFFGEHADEVLALYPASTDAEAKAYWAEIYGAIFFDYSHYCLNRLAVENGIPVWEYYFSRDNGRLGPWHSGEMIYCYGNIPADSKLFDARDRELSGQILRYFANYTKTGDPNGDGLPAWEENGSSSRLMEFGDETKMIDEREHALFAVLDAMQGWTD